MKTLARFSVAFAVFLIIGETWVLATTDKYWPLSVDDYCVCAALLFAAYKVKEPSHAPAYLAIWMFSFGNIYAMLFTRLDPVTGSGERIGALLFLLALIGFGAVLSAWQWRKAL